MKQTYTPPCILQTATVVLERGFLVGSVFDQVFPIETLGQEIENNYDYWNDGTTFNHTWGEE